MRSGRIQARRLGKHVVRDFIAIIESGSAGISISRRISIFNTVGRVVESRYNVEVILLARAPGRTINVSKLVHRNVVEFNAYETSFVHLTIKLLDVNFTLDQNGERFRQCRASTDVIVVRARLR